MKKNNFLTKAFTLLFVLLFNLTGARAIVTHTVYDGTATNTRVPVYGDHVGSQYIRSQFIIPSTELKIMAGGKITNMIFYADETVVNWYSSGSGNDEKANTFEVYVSETNDTNFGTYSNWNNTASFKSWAGKVYTGKLAVNGNQLIVDFNSPLTYTGKNLLIGIKQIENSDNSDHSKTATFKGQSFTSGNNTSVATYSNSNNNPSTGNGYRFIPKTTFVYIPGFIPTNENVGFNIITETTITGNPKSITANLSWNGDADSYEVRYRTKRPLFKETFDDSNSIPQGWTVWKKGEAPSSYPNGWGIYTSSSTGNSIVSSYSWLSQVAYDADNWLITPKVQLGGILKYDVAAITAWHDMYEVRVSTTGIAEADFTDANVVRPLTPALKGTQDYDLERFKGQEGYIAIRHKNKDGYYISIDNFELSSGHSWKRAYSNGNETSVQLPRLLPDLEYEYVIIGIKDGVRGETANLTFTTPHVPDIILPDDEDNEDLVYDVAGKTYNAYLAGRTFKSNGIWNTLALPFDVTVAGSPFEGALIYTVLDRSSVNNNVLTLRIDPVSTTNKLTAGTPYLITWEKENTVLDPIFEPNFSQVTFKKETYPVTGSVAGGTSITFTPNFNLLQYPDGDESVLFLSSNHLYYAGEDATIRPQRAYFKVNGANSVKGIAFEIVEDDADGINDVNANLNGNANIYNVAGQRLGKMQKGINIVNGKKIFIK